MALKENYKDDILDVSVNTKRKYRMTENADGTVSFDDETEYTQQGDSFGATDMNATNGKVNTIDSAVATLNANLDGFKFYPTGTGIVGLISDDSAYTDEDGNYVVWGTPTANQLVADNPNTYKSVPSTEDCRGEVGADTATPFKGSIKNILPKLGITASDYTLTNTGHVNYSNLEVDETHIKVSVRATSGPSGQTWMAYSEVVSNKSVDLTAYNTILFDGDGKVDQHVGYSKPSYMQIWFENVDNTNDKIYLHNHSSDYTENVTWTKKYVDITNASGKYKLHLYISEEDQQQVDYINLTKIYAFNITD